MIIAIICIVVFLGILLAALIEVARSYEKNFKD